MTRPMHSSIALGLSLYVVGLAACSAPEQAPQVAGAGEHASQSGQALDSAADRPAAAAVGVLVDPAGVALGDHELRATRQLWLFACSADQRLVRRVRADQRAAWSAWTVEAGTACAGPPSAGAWSVSPHDTVEVVYRSTDDRLIELSYAGNQAAQEVDLSAYTRFGKIASNSNPVIADMGTQGRVSIAVRNPANQLFALTAYNRAWHVQPARAANGGQVFAESTLVSWYSSQRALLSAVHNGVSQAFTRYSWKQGFRAFNAPVPAQASHGLITFTMYQGRVQALGRDENGVLVSAPVDQSWSFSPAPAHSPVQSTVYLGAPSAYRSAQSVNPAAVGIPLDPTARVTFVSGLDAFNPHVALTPADATEVASANALVSNPGSELSSENFVANADGELLWWSGGSSRTFTKLDLNVVY